MATDHGAATVKTPERGTPDSGPRLAAIRTASLAALAILVVEYVLGVAENLYGTMPSAHHPVGLFSGGALLAVHGVLGIALALGALANVARSAASRHRPLAVSSVIAALALAAATLLGFMFLGKGQDGASLGMALAAGIAMICYGFNVWVVSSASKPGIPDPHAGAAGQRRGESVPDSI